jgi:hypothetical protein
MMRDGARAGTWASLRIVVAALLTGAIVAQAIATFGAAIDEGRDLSTTIANFFSFFTILSNTAAVIVLVCSALWLWHHRAGARVEPRGLAIARTSVATYMIITGVVYNTLLRFLPSSEAAVPWSNEVLHVVGPLFLLLDVLFAPAPRAQSWRAVWAVLVFPLAWVVYTLLRANLVVNPLSGLPYWYPYPFLDPNNPAGYLSVAGYIVGIAAAIALTATFVVWVGRRRASRGAAAGAASPVLATPRSTPEAGPSLGA